MNNNPTIDEFDINFTSLMPSKGKNALYGIVIGDLSRGYILREDKIIFKIVLDVGG